MGNYWDDFKGIRNQPKKYWTPWFNKFVFWISLTIAIGVFLAVPAVRILNSSYTEPLPDIERETQLNTQEPYMDVLITGDDWDKMTQSQKSNWVNVTLYAMVIGEELSKSEVKSTSYYINYLDYVFSDPGSQKGSVAWELTGLTSQ